MTDSDHALDAVAHAASELLPELTERLARHGIGEIEVARGDLRLRVRAAPEAARPPEVPAAADARPADPPRPPGDRQPEVTSSFGVASPAVGFFVYADGLGPGLDVGKGDPLGYIEMLGVRHDVRAPRSGTVGHLVAESGEAVEYGQVVVEIEPAAAR
jgi:biotin carboxyl carrier protein